MPKILYLITQSEYGGAQRYVVDLANNLKDSYEVAVALGEHNNNLKLAEILQKNNIKYFIIPHLKRSLSPHNDILAFFEIIKLIKQYQPSIIHLNSSKVSILGSLAALCVKRYTLRVIYTVHGWVFNEPLPSLLKQFYLHAEKFTARFKHKIICVSEYDKKTALKYKIAPVEKLITIHNGLSPVSFYSEEEARQKIPLSPLAKEVLLIGSIGNLYKTKGFEYLIKAADVIINQKKLQAKFLVIGEGNERKSLEALIKKYNLENNFILAGRIDQAAKLLPAFDIHACSSVKEGFPYSILEAMQAGLPIVATNVGGIPEMIENNKTGLLAEPANPNNLAEKIIILINNKKKAEELGRSAKTRTASEFGLNKMVEETRKVYLNLLS